MHIYLKFQPAHSIFSNHHQPWSIGPIFQSGLAQLQGIGLRQQRLFQRPYFLEDPLHLLLHLQQLPLELVPRLLGLVDALAEGEVDPVPLGQHVVPAPLADHEQGLPHLVGVREFAVRQQLRVPGVLQPAFVGYGAGGGIAPFLFRVNTLSGVLLGTRTLEKPSCISKDTLESTKSIKHMHRPTKILLSTFF